jgi:hypothetical protein
MDPLGVMLVSAVIIFFSKRSADTVVAAYEAGRKDCKRDRANGRAKATAKKLSEKAVRHDAASEGSEQETTGA